MSDILVIIVIVIVALLLAALWLLGLACTLKRVATGGSEPSSRVDKMRYSIRG